MTAYWPRRSRIWSLSRLRLVSVALFRRLAVLTAVFAYLQIALGGVVRVSGSGLGCPDWPLCHGRPYPPADAHAIIEYSHRAVGSVTGVLIMTGVLPVQPSGYIEGTVSSDQFSFSRGAVSASLRVQGNNMRGPITGLSSPATVNLYRVGE